MQVGVFINLESTGPGGPDVLFQHTGKHQTPQQEKRCMSVKGTCVIDHLSFACAGQMTGVWGCRCMDA